MAIEVSARGFPQLKVGAAQQLHHEDLAACNTKSAPDKVAPTALGGVAIEGERIRMTLAGILEHDLSGAGMTMRPVAAGVDDLDDR